MAGSELKAMIDDAVTLAAAAMAGKNFDQAIGYLQGAEALDPQNQVVLYNLGAAYAGKGLYRTALGFLQRLLDSSVKTTDVLAVRKMTAFCHANLKEYDRAINLLRELLRVVPGDLAVLGMFAWCLEQKGLLRESAEVYERILRIENESTSALNNFAYVSVKNGGDPNRAMEYARRALASDESNAAYLDTIGYIYLKRGQTDQARQYLKRALEKMPESVEIRAHLNELLNIG